MPHHKWKAAHSTHNRSENLSQWSQAKKLQTAEKDSIVISNR